MINGGEPGAMFHANPVRRQVNVNLTGAKALQVTKYPVDLFLCTTYTIGIDLLDLLGIWLLIALLHR
jgi:hypothetical protein